MPRAHVLADPLTTFFFRVVGRSYSSRTIDYWAVCEPQSSRSAVMPRNDASQRGCS